MTRLMVKENTFIMSNNSITKASGNMTCSMDLVEKSFAITHLTKVNSSKGKSKVSENTSGLICPFMKESGKKMKCVVSASSSPQTNGLM